MRANNTWVSSPVVQTKSQEYIDVEQTLNSSGNTTQGHISKQTMQQTCHWQQRI